MKRKAVKSTKAAEDLDGNVKASPKNKKISVVFICTGNICRSPVAEFLCKHALRQKRIASRYRVSSAGISAYDGLGMSRLSAEVLSAARIPFTAHKSRRLTDKMLDTSDFIICMTDGHKRALEGANNAFSVAEITGYGDVSDPYGGTLADYQKMFDHLSYAMPEILVFVERKSQNR